MGREAVCTCDWAGEVAEVKAVLESREVILRGNLRRRVAFEEINDLKVEADSLCFRVGRDRVQLVLGYSAAEKWAVTIAGPPPSLAQKLGISRGTIVRTVGKIEDENLKADLSEAARISDEDEDLIVAVVETQESLRSAFKQSTSALKNDVPIWIVYKKGPGNALNETAIRAFLRDNRLMDTKVVSVSTKFTALRFIGRKTS